MQVRLMGAGQHTVSHWNKLLQKTRSMYKIKSGVQEDRSRQTFPHIHSGMHDTTLDVKA